MIWPLEGWWSALLSSVVWPLTFAAVGWWGARLPSARLAPGPLTRIRAWERDGRTWDRWLRVRRWKGLVPDAGSWLGGSSKRDLVARGRGALGELRAETVRAERVHWWVLASAVVHAAWCPPRVLAGMVVFGVVANVPCILIQRSNRGRVERLLARRAAAGRSAGPTT